MKLLFLGDYCSGSENLPVLSADASELFQLSDLICANLEAPIISPNFLPEAKAGPSLSQGEKSLMLARKLGITHYAMANNHIMDYGQPGLEQTLQHLPQGRHMGAGLNIDDAYKPCLFTCEGITVALFSFAEAQFGAIQDDVSTRQTGYAWIDHPIARQAVTKARKEADFVIVQAHAGLEMVSLPLPEWRSRYREFIDLGADLVIGHHPHVIQGSEEYNDKMIHYSLGNFYMDCMLNQEQPGSGAALKVSIISGRLTSELIPLTISRDLIALDDSEKTRTHYIKLCTQLTNQLSYNAEIDTICEDFWQTVYSGYYESALTGFGTRPGLISVLRAIKRFAGTVLRKQKVPNMNELMLVHNIRIESHRWVVARALGNRIAKVQ